MPTANKSSDPWDPFWEYVLGDEQSATAKKNRTQRNKDQLKKSDSYLSFFQDDDDLRKSRSRSFGSTRERSSFSRERSSSSKSAGGQSRRRKADDNASFIDYVLDDDRNDKTSFREFNKKSGRWGFFGPIKEDDDNSFLSFLDQPYEIHEAEHKRKESKREKRMMKTLRDQQKKTKRVRKKKSQDDESWLPSTLSSFTSDEGSKKKTKTPSRPLFGWGGGKTKPKQKETKEPRRQRSAQSGSTRSVRRHDSGGRRQSPRKQDVDSPDFGDALAESFESFDIFGGSSGEYSSEYTEEETESLASSYRSEETEVSTEGEASTFAKALEASRPRSTRGPESSQNCQRDESELTRRNSVERLEPARKSRMREQSDLSRRNSVGERNQGAGIQTNEIRLKYDPSKYVPTNELQSHQALASVRNYGGANPSNDAQRKSSGVGSPAVLQSRLQPQRARSLPVLPTTATPSSFATPSQVARTAAPREEYAIPRMPSHLPKSSERRSVQDESLYYPSQSPRAGLLGKVVCCSSPNLGPEGDQFSRETGLPVHELTREELADLFPKLRSVAEQLPPTARRSRVIGNSASFEQDMPAHLQAIVSASGPQSLYEYEYEKGAHQALVYDNFSPNPRSVLKIQTYEMPPRLSGDSIFDQRKVIIQVEASTVSQSDCCIRSGQWMGRGTIPLPNSPGVDVVGRICSLDKSSAKVFDLRVGERVMALTKYGGHARYLVIDADQLVKVPETVDPAEAVCLVETYLTAFQTLHVQQSFGARYRQTSLRGKSVLVIGNVATNLGRAIAQLGTAAAVEDIYATAKPKNFEKLTSYGVVPLSQNPIDWYERLQGRIDLIISIDQEITPLHYKMLTASGEIILVTQSEVDLTNEPSLYHIHRRSKLMCQRYDWKNKSRTQRYDVYSSWEDNLVRSKRDLEHLLRLLDERRVYPHVIDRVPLNKVVKAQQILEEKNVPGFIVCEPWISWKSRAVVL